MSTKEELEKMKKEYRKMKSKVGRKARKLALVAATTASSLTMNACSGQNTQTEDKQLEPVEVSVDPVAAHKAKVEAHIKKMKEEGRFFVDAKTGEVKYLTNAECDSLKLGPVANIYDVCFARENGLSIYATGEERDAAYANTKGSFFVGYQYNNDNLKSMLLFGLCQTENPEIRALCEKAFKPGASRESLAFKYFEEGFQKADQKMAYIEPKMALNAVYYTKDPIRARALALLQVGDNAQGDALVKKLSAADPEAWKNVQHLYMQKVYMHLMHTSKQLGQIDIPFAAAALCAAVHRFSSQQVERAIAGNVDAIIKVEAGKYSGPLMREAQKNMVKMILGRSYYDENLVAQCRATGFATSRVDYAKIEENLFKVAEEHMIAEEREANPFNCALIKGEMPKIKTSVREQFDHPELMKVVKATKGKGGR